ncbi:MAG: hypothetical protein HOY76_23985, partial [Streptomyces sp.]|nr:hypothetical protein [Streptomyces sp.]
VALIGRIEEEGTALGSVVRGVMEVIRGVERALKALKEIRGVAEVAKMAKGGAEFSAFETLLKDPGAFKDPEKLAGILAEGAVMGVGFGVLGKALGKGLKALGPAALAKLSKSLGLDCAAFERLKLNPGFDKLPASVRNMVKKFVRDPIDVATGDMALPRTDVQLPGVLPLILQRTHLSSYRFGGWFGPSWASTLDQRIQADDEGFVFAAADGARLCFPPLDPAGSDPVRPLTPGSRLTLSWDTETDGAIRVSDPDSGLAYVFHSPVAAAGDTAVDLPLQHITDRNNNRITIVYAEGDIPSAVVHSGGYHLALDHDKARARITGLRLLDPAHPDRPGTTLLTFGYDEHGHLSEEFNSSGLPMRYTYDADGRITSWTDRNDTTYWYRYDDQGRVIATGGTAGALASTLTYDDTTRTTHVTDSLGHVRTYEHNEHLRLTRETDPLGNATCQEWDSALQLTTVMDPLGHLTRYRYDEHGRLVEVTRPDGRTTVSTYNTFGQPTTITEVDGTEWRQDYDEHGNPTEVTDAVGATTRSTYNSAGHLTTVTDALGNVTRVRCSPAGLPEDITDPLGATVRYERDVFGRPVTLTDPLGRTTRLEWTVEGKPARRVMPDGSTESWTYDGEGNCTTHTDVLGMVSCYEYTCFDLLAARTGPDGVRHTFTHDTELRLTQVTNPQGLTWAYEYDAAGRLLSETDFDGRALVYSHDPGDRLIARTNALGQTTRFTHDELGQIATQSVDGVTTTFTYDPSGRLVQVVSPDARIDQQHDANGRLLSEAVNGRIMSYSYDPLGRRIGRTTPNGATSHWSYDAVGNPTRLTTAGRTIDFEYDPAGQETARRLGDAVTVASTLDALGRLSLQTVTGADGRSVRRRAYRYRADGNPVQLDDQRKGIRRFALDKAGRVISVEATDWTERYAYDTAGNQTDASWPASHAGAEAVGARTYSGTRLTRAGGVRYEHDALGRVVLRQKTRLSRKPDTWRYIWDTEDRLVSVVTPDGIRWRYLYDPLGRRIAKQRLTADGASVAEQTDFTWDGTTLCEQITTAKDVPNPVIVTWDHHDLRPISQTERINAADSLQEEIDSRFFAVVTDLVGTPTELLGEQGEIAWESRATLWGTTTWAASSAAYTPLRFPGQYFDPETGMHYNYFRTYDPEVGRYLTPDPLGLAPADNPNSYVHNPQTWTDPLGLAPCLLGKWADKADFSSQKVMSKKFHAHAGDFLDSPGNLNGANLKAFEKAMREHMTADGTKIFRYNYRKQGQAVGFIDPQSLKMVMLRTDGRFWSAYKLNENQFADIVQRGFLW